MDGGFRHIWVQRTNHIRKPSNLIKFSLNHGLLSIIVWKLDVLTRKGLDSRQHCWHSSENGWL